MQAVRALARRVTMKRVVGTVAGCGGLVAAQAVYYQASYVPMRGPADGGTCGIEHWEDHEDDEGAQRRDGGGAPGWSLRDPRRWRNVLIVGDSLVVGIGCKERSVLPQVISRSLANALKVDVSWRTIGVDGGDMKTIHANVLETVKRFQDEQTARIKAADEEQSELALSQHSALPSCDKAPGGARADHSEEVGTSIVRNVSGGLPVVKMKIMEHLQHKPPQVKLAGEALFDFVSTSMRRRVQGAGGEPAPRAGVDAVVVMVGLNDFKKILRGSTSPGLFRSDIESFMRDLREQVGPDCIVVFPGLPAEVMVLPEPLKTAATAVAHFYDEEKRALAARQALVHFIPKPAVELWERTAAAHGVFVAPDGVHPNEIGYRVFAEHVGGELARLCKQQAAARDARGRGGDVLPQWGGGEQPSRS